MTASQTQTVMPSSPAPKKRTVQRPSAKRTAPVVLSEPVAVDVTPELIAEQAYFIWLHKGRPVGQDEQNWIEAETALLAKKT